jgi:transposase
MTVRIAGAGTATVDAWLGLVPRQESTGDRTILGKISKRGNKYLRTLFVQAACQPRPPTERGKARSTALDRAVPSSSQSQVKSVSVSWEK